jgi:methyl-accepting chemotaxis protein
MKKGWFISMILMKKKQQKNTVESVVVKEAKEDTGLTDAVMKKSLACNEETLVNVNKLLQFMTSLDYVKGMILDANKQADLVETVAASSEEMSASTEDISNYVQNSNVTAKQTIDETASSLRRIDAAFLTLSKNIEETKAVKTVMDEVTEETEKINSMVNVIKSVADQTNLLALNASIEAARAGEHGKGFAVVADEIRKLAESTRQQVGYIQEVVNGLNGKINKTSSEIEKVIKTFQDSKKEMDEATDGIRGINKSMIIIGDSFNEISANVQEQTAVSQEMSANLLNINEKANVLKTEANRTGEAFYEISEQIDQVRMHALAVVSGMNSKSMIEVTITDHLLWKWKVYNMILGYVKLKTEAVGDSNGCRLGKWLLTLDRSNPRITTLIETIKKPHGQLHEDAKRAIQAYERHNLLEAEAILLEIEKSSKAVVKALEEMKHVL